MTTSARTAARPRFNSVSALASAERILALTLTLLFALLCVLFTANAGGLWRDEANSVSLAGETSLATIVRHLDADSFPLLWLLVLRGWIALGFAHTDFGIRALGLLTALCVPAALLCHARATRTPFPFWAFLLLGLNPIFIRAIGSTRAYGLGVVLVLLASAAFARASEKLTPRLAAAVFVLALLCVQCIYYNILFIEAMCLGAILAAYRRHDRNAITFFAGVWAIDALTLLPYLPAIVRQHDWSVLIAHPVSTWGLALVLGQALGADGSVFVIVWTILLALALRAAWKQRTSGTALYAATVLLVSFFGYWLFLQILRYQISPWYYAELMALAAVQIDTLLAGAPAPATRASRAALIGLALLPAFSSARPGVELRQTGMDLAAAYVQTHTHSGDLVLVNPWYYGTPFNRYYHGAWDTVPTFPFHKYGGMDEMKRRMTEQDPAAPTLAAIKRTLCTGHAVWLVGDIPFVIPGEKVRALPPAPASVARWNSAAYRDTWGRQAQSVLVQRAAIITVHEITASHSINALENPQVEECRGWRHP